MLIRKNKIKYKKTKEIKKSQILLFGSLLIFSGILMLSWNKLSEYKEEIFSEMMIKLSEVAESKDENKVEVKLDNIKEQSHEDYIPKDFSKYLGVLEVPKINLKRGFYDTSNKYNDIKYNVTLMGGSSLPDHINGNLILVAHSGTAYISYFRKLYLLNKYDEAYVTYNGIRYRYVIKDIYHVEKNGLVRIVRNSQKTTLTLITCTKDDDTKQTVYIAELE